MIGGRRRRRSKAPRSSQVGGRRRRRRMSRRGRGFMDKLSKVGKFLKDSKILSKGANAIGEIAKVANLVPIPAVQKVAGLVTRGTDTAGTYLNKFGLGRRRRRRRHVQAQVGGRRRRRSSKRGRGVPGVGMVDMGMTSYPVPTTYAIPRFA